MLWGKEEEEGGIVKATCDLLSNSVISEGKKITNSAPKALRNNVDFSEWVTGIYRWRQLSSHITNKTSPNPSLGIAGLLQVLLPKADDLHLVLILSFCPDFLLHRPVLPEFPFSPPSAFPFFCFPILPSKKWLSYEPNLDSVFPLTWLLKECVFVGGGGKFLILLLYIMSYVYLWECICCIYPVYLALCSTTVIHK